MFCKVNFISTFHSLILFFTVCFSQNSGSLSVAKTTASIDLFNFSNHSEHIYVIIVLYLQLSIKKYNEDAVSDKFGQQTVYDAWYFRNIKLRTVVHLYLFISDKVFLIHLYVICTNGAFQDQKQGENLKLFQFVELDS